MNPRSVYNKVEEFHAFIRGEREFTFISVVKRDGTSKLHL